MVYELPLFPLNTVLFPGMPLALHIFEERYKTMIRECIDRRQPFGVALIEHGQEAHGPLAEPCVVGCSAQIAQVQQLPAGRMNILALGAERFRIRTLSRSKAYLMGEVEAFPLLVVDRRLAAKEMEVLRPWLEQYLELLSEIGDMEFDSSQLPDDPVALAFLGATVLQIPARQKQGLLAEEGAEALLAQLSRLTRQEIPMLRLMMEEEEFVREGPAGFSLS